MISFRSIDAYYPYFRSCFDRAIIQCKGLMIEKANELKAEIIVDVKPLLIYYEGNPNSIYITGIALIKK